MEPSNACIFFLYDAYFFIRCIHISSIMVMMGLLLASTIILLKPLDMLFTTMSQVGLDVNLDLDQDLLPNKINGIKNNRQCESWIKIMFNTCLGRICIKCLKASTLKSLISLMTTFHA